VPTVFDDLRPTLAAAVASRGMLGRVARLRAPSRDQEEKLTATAAPRALPLGGCRTTQLKEAAA
jgi:hypothetical protein